MTKSNIKFHILERGPKSVAYCFSDVETEIKSKLYVSWFKLLSVILCRSKLFAILSPIRPLHWASLQFEDKLEDSANFQETLHNFPTSCAR